MAKLTPEQLAAKIENHPGDAFSFLTVLERGEHADDVKAWASRTSLQKGALVQVDLRAHGEVTENLFYVGPVLVPYFGSIDNQGVLHPTLRLSLSAYYPAFIQHVVKTFTASGVIDPKDLDVMRVHVLNK